MNVGHIPDEKRGIASARHRQIADFVDVRRGVVHQNAVFVLVNFEVASGDDDVLAGQCVGHILAG